MRIETTPAGIVLQVIDEDGESSSIHIDSYWVRSVTELMLNLDAAANEERARYAVEDAEKSKVREAKGCLTCHHLPDFPGWNEVAHFNHVGEYVEHRMK